MEAELLRPTNAALRDLRYWLAHREGFELHDGVGFLGWVEELVAGREAGSVRALLVLVGSAGAAAALRDFFCVGCGYGAGGASPPARCPMCAGASWQLAERVRHAG